MDLKQIYNIPWFSLPVLQKIYLWLIVMSFVYYPQKCCLWRYGHHIVLTNGKMSASLSDNSTMLKPCKFNIKVNHWEVSLHNKPGRNVLQIKTMCSFQALLGLIETNNSYFFHSCLHNSFLFFFFTFVLFFSFFLSDTNVSQALSNHSWQAKSWSCTMNLLCHVDKRKWIQFRTMKKLHSSSEKWFSFNGFQCTHQNWLVWFVLLCAKQNGPHLLRMYKV